MLKTLFRRKLSDEQLANVFVNAMLDCVDKGFDEVVELIKEDPAFVTVPDLENYSDGHFTMIVIVANLSFLGDHFDPQQCADLENLIKEKFADIFGMSKDLFDTHLNNYKKFMSRVNHPSKNMHYAMSKGMFHKYQLNDYQDGYFKKMKCPNPLFLKRMDEVMDSFVWNWDAFFKRYKMVG